MIPAARFASGIVMCFSPQFFKFTCFLDSSFSSTMDKYRMFRGRCQDTGLLSGYEKRNILPGIIKNENIMCLDNNLRSDGIVGKNTR